MDVGFMLIGFCGGLVVGIMIMFFADAKIINEVADEGLKMAHKISHDDHVEMARMVATITELQTKINGSPVTKKANDTEWVEPEWLKDFTDVSISIPDGPDFGGITL